jgi:hypothetical protein
MPSFILIASDIEPRTQDARKFSMRIFLMGANPAFDTHSVTSPAARRQKTGGNSGNQVIAYGLLKGLSYNTVSWDGSLSPSRVNELFDVIVIAAANFLFPNFDFTQMADFIEATDLPCVMVGVGAQSNDYNVNLPLKPGTVRLMQIVSERSKLIGARGPFSAEVLANIGVKNVQVTGCPSYYMSGLPTLSIDKPALPKHPKVSINLSRDVIPHSFDPLKMKDVIRGIAGEAIRFDGEFVAQTELDEIVLSEGKETPESDEALARAFEFFKGISSDDAVRIWLRNNMRVYWSVDKWLAHARQLDFVVGQRFHGNMVAIQAHKPAMFVCHDSRTTEMCEFLGLPFLQIREIGNVNFFELYDRVDVDKLSATYKRLYPLYKSFLESNGLRHTLD